MPSALHVALQQHYAGPTGLVEAQVAGYRVDVLRDGVVYEIQTGAFSSIRKKLDALAQTHRVVIVFPLPHRKTIVRLDPETGEVLSSRRSPRRAPLTDLFRFLPYLARVLTQSNLALEVVQTEERDFRQDDGRGSWRRRGVSLVGRELVQVVATHRFERPADYLRLLPADLPAQFTRSDLAAAAHIGLPLAGKGVYALRHIGAVRLVGRRGRAFLYERAVGRRSRRRRSP